MNSAFKVGLITLLTLGTIMVGVLFIWQINPYSNYVLYGYFPHVGGIKAGSEVTLMGVKIGEIASVTPEPAKQRVRVGMQIDNSYTLPVGSTFTIVTTGLVGDKSLEVLPPAQANVEKDSEGEIDIAYLQAGDEVQGTPPASLDAIFTEAQGMLKSARALVKDETLQSDIKTTVKMVARSSEQMNDLFADIKGVTQGFGRLTTQTETLLKQVNQATATAIPEVQNVVSSVRRIAYNVEHLSGRINQIVDDPVLFDDTRGTVTNVREMTQKWNELSDDLKNMSIRSDRILDNAESITNDIRDITSDKEIQSSIRSVAKNASALSNTILRLADPATQTSEQLDIDIRTEALGFAGLAQDFTLTPGAQVNFNVFGDLGLDIPISYFRAGIDSIGDGNLINLQTGTHIADGTGILRFGLVRGRIGAGADLNVDLLGKPLTLSGEFYDINIPHMRLGIFQNLYEDYGFSFYWDNQFLKGINEFSFGFRWQPGSNKAKKKASENVESLLPLTP